MLGRRQLLGAALVSAGSLLLPVSLQARRRQPKLRQWQLTAAGGRAVEISDWRPSGAPRGLILFSHGAGSAPHFYEAVIGAWVARGWRVLAPLHVDSVEHPDTARFPGLASWKARLEDMRALSAHVGQRPWVAAGHSYGGLVALTLGGAAAIPPQGLAGRLDDPNVRAVVALSPPAPTPVLITAERYGALRVPALIQTGTLDVPQMPKGMAPLPADSWHGHLAPFEAAKPGNDRYALILDGVDHYFGGAICRYDLPGPRQLERLADACRISGLFLDGLGAGDHRARRELDSALSQAYPVQLLHK